MDGVDVVSISLDIWGTYLYVAGNDYASGYSAWLYGLMPNTLASTYGYSFPEVPSINVVSLTAAFDDNVEPRLQHSY